MENKFIEEISESFSSCNEDLISFTKEDSEFSDILEIWKQQRRSDCNIQNPQKLCKCLPCNKIHFKTFHGSRIKKQIRFRQGNAGFQCLVCQKQYHEYYPSSEFKLHLLTHTKQQLIESSYDIKKIWKNSKAVYEILEKNEQSYNYFEEGLENSENLQQIISHEPINNFIQDDFEKQLFYLQNSKKQNEKQKEILYLQFPYVSQVLQEDISSILYEATQSKILINSNLSFDNIPQKNATLFHEIFEREDLRKYPKFVLQLRNQFKYQKMAHDLILKWLLPLQNRTITPFEIVLTSESYSTTLEDYLQNHYETFECGKIIWMLNFGISHKNIQPKNILINCHPKLTMKLTGFHYTTFYQDENLSYSYKFNDYSQNKPKWPNGSRNWDIFLLGLIICEWYIKKKTRNISRFKKLLTLKLYCVTLQTKK